MSPRRAVRRAVAAVACLALLLAGCAHGPATHAPVAPATLRAVPGTTLHEVTLTPQALADVGLRTTAVQRAGALTAIPLSALIYDPEGRAWTYVPIGPRTFVRRPVTIATIRDGMVLLRSGPTRGTPVVTVGAPELLGAEYGVGEE